MRRFVFWSIVALQLVLFVREPCSGTLRGHGRLRRRDELRVRFGVDDVHNKYPYVVAILHTFRRFCTGSLITPEWGLTAAHCSDGSYIRFGNMTTKKYNKYFRKIKKIISHPGGRPSPDFLPAYVTHDNDIALFQIEPVYLKYYGNVSALNHWSLVGYPVEYAGFGSTLPSSDENYVQMQEEDEVRPLQLGRGVVVPCYKVTLNVPNLCVAPKCTKNQQDTLPGDSGGPMFYGGKIVGTLCGGLVPSISSYIPVSPFLDWIHNTLMAHDEKIVKKILSVDNKISM